MPLVCTFLTASKYAGYIVVTGEHFGDEFTKINPFQRVPVIDDNGFVLSERYCLMKYSVVRGNKLTRLLWK